MSDSRVTPAWNFKGMLMENNSRVITNADATLTQKIYDYGEVSPEQSSVTVVKDDDMAHFYFNICSEKGEPAYIKITKDDDGNIVITGTDHSGTTQQTILASKIELTENDKGVLISVLATENGELIKKEAQVYDSTISVEEKDYGALVTMTNSKGTSSEAKLYSPTISAERLEDNTGVKIIITSGKEGVTPTVVNLYDPIVTGKRVTGGAEITIQNHIDEEPQIINLYDAGSASIAPEYDETQEYKKFNYCIYNNTMYVCLEDTTGPFDETKWQETKVSYELDNVSLKIVAEEWDGSKTYSIGDYVMYDKILYKCISNEEGSETAYPNITTSKWKTIFIMDEIPNIATTEKAGIVKVGNNLTIEEDGTLSANADLSIIAEEWDKTKMYSIGDYVLYNNKLYKCLSSKTGAGINIDLAKEEYIFNKNENVANMGSNRPFVKINDELSFGAWVEDATRIDPHYDYPVLISNISPEAAQMKCTYNNQNVGSTEIELFGEKWWITNESYVAYGTSNTGTKMKKAVFSIDPIEQALIIAKDAGIYQEGKDPSTSAYWEEVLVMDEIKNKQSVVPIASAETAGIVKVGKNLEITEDGTLNAKAGGGNANEMELTWAEYLALTDEEKNNGTTYYITDKNPTSSEKGFKSTLLATLNDQPQEIDFSNYDLILYQAYNNEVNLYSSAVFMPSFINRAGNIILSIDVTDRIIIDSTNAITLNAFNCAIDVYGMTFVGLGGEGGASSLTDLTDIYIQNLKDKQILSYNSSTKRWENIEVNFSSDVKYAKLYFDSDNGNTVKPTSITVPLTFDNVVGNLEVIDNQKIKLEKGKIYLTYAQGQKGNWSGSLYINIRNSQEQIISQNGADTNYTGVSVSTIYKCEIDNDYLYYSSSNGQGTDSGSSRAFSTQFFVVELNESGSGSGTSNMEYLSDIKDVKITNPEKDQILVYDDITKTWINKKNNAVAELPNNIAYITDSSETKEIKIRANQHNYSTEEQIIGTWIDGKPIYEISYYNETPNVSSTYNEFISTGVILNNIDNIININGTVIRDIGDGKLCYPIAYESNDYKLIVRPYAIGNSDDYDIKYCAYFSSNSIKNIVIIIQYTKTTD